MTRHQHHRPRRRSSSGSEASSDSDSRSESDRSRKSEHSGHHKRSSYNYDLDKSSESETDSESKSESDTSSSGSSGGDSRRSSKYHREEEEDTDEDEDEYYQHHKSRRREESQRKVLFWGLGGILLLLALVTLYVATKNEKSSSSSASASLTTAGSASKSTSASSSPNASKASGGSSSNTGTSSSAASSASSASSASTPDASNSGPYKLVQDWKGDNFFEGWEFWDQADPTHGSVNYLSQDAAKSSNLISTSADSIIMKVDNTTKLDSGKFRDSVRIHSKTGVKIGSIIIADIIKMPFGCSTWPAWWTNGQNWPAGGEIDIIEGVNNQPENSLTLHVSDSDCKQDPDVDITGKPIPENDDCNANVKSNQGCSYQEVADASYGEPFNKAGGGVLVTSFTKDAIDIWFWSRPNVPENIQKESPDKSTWGKPSASWPTKTCNIEKYFGDQTMIFDTTLCGDWAGAESVWSRDCGDKASTCQEYLMDPSHFDDAYWEVGYVRVYEIS